VDDAAQLRLGLGDVGELQEAVLVVQ
jgi:hypothetical protein